MRITKTVTREVKDNAQFKEYLHPEVSEIEEAVSYLYGLYSGQDEVDADRLKSWTIDSLDMFLFRQTGSLSAQAMRGSLIDLINWSSSIAEIATNLTLNFCGVRTPPYFLDGGAMENRTFHTLVLYSCDCYV